MWFGNGEGFHIQRSPLLLKGVFSNICSYSVVPVVLLTFRQFGVTVIILICCAIIHLDIVRQIGLGGISHVLFVVMGV